MVDMVAPKLLCNLTFFRNSPIVDDAQAPVACLLEDLQLDSLRSQLDKLQAETESELKGRGFQAAALSSTRYLNLRFQGTDVALMVASECMSDYKPAFLRMYQQEFGFVLQDRPIVVDDARYDPKFHKVLSEVFAPMPPNTLSSGCSSTHLHCDG
jgi:N-methylhydantoinase A/oxoprolinase/acetone carboxylase beta subunit